MSSPWKNIPQMLTAQVERYQERAALKVKRGFAYCDISWKELGTQVQELALGLMDLEIASGDRIAILSENRPEWAIADLATLSVGGVVVPVYTSLTSKEIEYILRNSKTKLIFVSNMELMSKVLPFAEAMDLKVVLFDAPYRASGPRIWWLGELFGLGRTSGPGPKQEFPQRLAQLEPTQLASIIYTSGTTGPPKGVMLTHDNFLSNCRAIGESLPLGENDVTLSFLPLCHVFERTGGYYFVLHQGGTIAYAENQDSVPDNLREIHPTVVTGVPRFFEKIHERIQESIQTSSKSKQRIFRWALGVGQRRTERYLEGLPIDPTLAATYTLADLLVFSKLRERLGGKLRFFVSGGAPLSKELAQFFYAAGVLILEGYGLTETSPVITVNRANQFRFGSVGQAVPGVEVKIADDEEILTRGPHLMQGYFNNQEATDEVIDSEGWFHTGDIGTLSADGFLTITDRKKDLIKTSGGKMVAPQNLEAKLKADPYIDDCVIIGDMEKYLVALVVPNLEKCEGLAKRKGLSYGSIPQLLEFEAIIKAIEERVERLNEQLASFEQIKKITLLAEPFTQSSGELTPTLKIKRKAVSHRYSAQIEAMYQ